MKKTHYLLSIFLLFTAQSCQQEIDEFLVDNHQSANVPRHTVKVNVDGKLRATFYQLNIPPVNGSERQIQNYVHVTNISDDSIKNLKLLLYIYEDGSQQQELLLNRTLVNSKTIAIGDQDSLYLNSIFEQVPSSENIRLAILEWNDDKTACSAKYSGYYRAFKNNVVIDGGHSWGYVDYLGNTRVRIANNEEMSLMEGFFFPDTTFIGTAFNSTGQKYSDLVSKSTMQNDSLVNTLSFLDSDSYDSLVLTLKKQ